MVMFVRSISAGSSSSKSSPSNRSASSMASTSVDTMALPICSPSFMNFSPRPSLW